MSDSIGVGETFGQLPEIRPDVFLTDIAKALNTTADKLHTFNLPVFLQKSLAARFLYGTVRPDSAPRAFFKVATQTTAKEQLELEEKRTSLIRKLGIPGVDILCPYTILAEGNAGIASFSSLDGDSGLLFADKEMVAAYESQGLGTLSARAILNVLKVEVPENIDSKVLRRDNPLNSSKESFWKSWEAKVNEVMAMSNRSSLKKYIRREKLKRIVEQTKLNLAPVIERLDGSKKEYLVHNDQAPTNMYYPESPDSLAGSVLIIDWEHAGAVKNPALAAITEFADFYRSCPNLKMQQEFLEQIMTQDTDLPNHLLNLNMRHQILRGAIVFGTLLHSASRMNRSNTDPRFKHNEAAFLLTKLTENLDFIAKFAKRSTPLKSSLRQ